MPFRARGKWVQKKTGGKWRNWRKLVSEARAKATAAKLNILHSQGKMK